MTVQGKKVSLFRFAHHVTIPEYMEAAVLLSCQDAGVMKIETHGHIAERRC